MARRKKKSGVSAQLIIIGMLLVCAVAAGAYYYMNNQPTGLKLPAQKPVVTVTPTPGPAASERTVYIYLPRKSKNGIGFYLARTAIKSAEKGDILDVALDALLDTNKEGGSIAALIPAGTKSISPVKVHDGVATIDLSSQFVDNFSGGSDQEALTVNAIAHTIVANSSDKVSSVLILVDGGAVETLGGHLELNYPVEADSTLLHPGASK